MFYGSRLVIARRSRALTQTELAALLGIHQRTVSSYECGSRKPDDETVRRIADVLRYPVAYFSESDVVCLDDSVATFRARRSMPDWLRDKALAYGQNAASCVWPAFTSMFNLPSLDLPNAVKGESPETAANMTRDAWNLGEEPIGNMVQLLESKGIQLFWLDEYDMRVDAFSFWQDGQPFIMLNRPAKSGDRVRFNLAHELAHILLHSDVLIDPTEEQFDWRKEESEADEFAAAFLLPQYSFLADCPPGPNIQPYLELKRKWRTSIQAMLHRSWKLKNMTDWHYKLASIEISSRGWRTKEPVTVPAESSRIHTLIFTRLSANGVTPESFAIDQAHIDPDDLLQLCPAALEFARRPMRRAMTDVKSHTTRVRTPTAKPSDDDAPQLRLVKD